ncbi:MAG: hypothetical protein KJO95_08180 [Gammaproteobacteria bacterium]|nr:hypothetical protein [Gammaproteobacteria bacterium]
MTCDGLTLTSTVPVLTLQSTVPTLSLASDEPELSLASESCVLEFSVSTPLTFTVQTQSLQLASTGIDLCLTSPIPIGVGEANEAENCGAGAGVFREKVGTTLRFRSLQSLSDGLTIAENDGECTVDFDLDPTQLEKWNVTPSGDLNGVNVTYTLPDDVAATSLRLYRNGVRQKEDAGGACDFELGESGGAGTGYDTIVINTPALLSWEQLTADYLVAG